MQFLGRVLQRQKREDDYYQVITPLELALHHQKENTTHEQVKRVKTNLLHDTLRYWSSL